MCVDRCPDLFVVLEDGLGYVFDDGGVVSEAGRVRPVPRRHEDAAIDAADHCPGECIYLEADRSSPLPDDDDILDAEIDAEIEGE